MTGRLAPAAQLYEVGEVWWLLCGRTAGMLGYIWRRSVRRRCTRPLQSSGGQARYALLAFAVDEGWLAARHLMTADPRFEAVVNAHGTLCLRRGRPESGSAFAALVKTICF